MKRNPKITVTKRLTFETAHYLEGYDGKCAHVHGHSYKVEVTVGSDGLQPDGQMGGMVFDLVALGAVMKPIVDTLDHSLVVERESSVLVCDDSGDWGAVRKEGDLRMVVLGVRPTTENLALWFAARLAEGLPEGVWLDQVRIQETETSWVTVDYSA